MDLRFGIQRRQKLLLIQHKAVNDPDNQALRARPLPSKVTSQLRPGEPRRRGTASRLNQLPLDKPTCKTCLDRGLGASCSREPWPCHPCQEGNLRRISMTQDPQFETDPCLEMRDEYKQRGLVIMGLTRWMLRARQATYRTP